jgi:uncharacterized protein (DUF1501 family)
MMTPSFRCPGPLSRRGFLSLGALALGGAGVGNLLGLRAAATREAGRSAPDTSVIFLWLPGGPPHMEMYDLKPDAPAEYRGAFKPIRTKVPGLDVCELLPLHARAADKFALVRSIAHHFPGHGDGMKHLLTGRDPGTPNDFVTTHPMVGSVVAKCREQVRRGVPNYVAVTDPGRQGIDVYGFGSAYLGASALPFIFAGDPSSPKFQVPNLAPSPSLAGRLPGRLGLLNALDRPSAALHDAPLAAGMDVSRARAVDLLHSAAARKAFDISAEPARLRERYGMHAWGQRCLLARRLVEHGASWVTMVLENPYQSGLARAKDGTYNWDSHAVNCHLFNDLKHRLPVYDRCVSALVEDLYDRGLDKRVLLVVTGEFGRTPRIEHQTGTETGVKQPGRDHWPSAMSVLLAGGGLRVGQVVGSTTSKGERPKDRPLRPTDLWATVFRHLGIDWLNTQFLDYSGRPLPILPSGEPIKELV